MRATIYSNGAKLIYLKRDEVKKALENIAKEITEKFSEVEAVYLFGSFARGEERGFSDMDLLIVVKTPLNRSNFWTVYEKFFSFLADRLELAFDLLVVEKEREEETLKKLGPHLLISKT